jgi:hypothetical protein
MEVRLGTTGANEMILGRGNSGRLQGWWVAAPTHSHSFFCMLLCYKIDVREPPTTHQLTILINNNYGTPHHTSYQQMRTTWHLLHTMFFTSIA